MSKERRTRAVYGAAAVNRQWFKEYTFSYDGTLAVAVSMPYLPGNKRVLGGFNCLVDLWDADPDGTTVAFDLSFIYVAITDDPVTGFQVRTATVFDTVPILVGYYQSPFEWPTSAPRQNFNITDELIVAIVDPGDGIAGSPANMNIHVYFA